VTFIEPDGSWPIVWERAKGVHVWDADGKKYLDPGLTVPHQRPNQLAGQIRHVGNFAYEQTHVDVIHQHEKDGQPAKQIHSVNSRAVRHEARMFRKGHR